MWVSQALLCSPRAQFPPDVSAGGSRHAPRSDDRGFGRHRRADRLGRRQRRVRDSRRRDRRSPRRNRRRLLSLSRGALVRTTTLGAPRPVPGRLLPVAAGAGVIALALPVFLLADWPFAGYYVQEPKG